MMFGTGFGTGSDMEYSGFIEILPSLLKYNFQLYTSSYTDNCSLEYHLNYNSNSYNSREDNIQAIIIVLWPAVAAAV